MERYRRVNSSRTAAPSCIKENEIRITTQGMSGGYISYALSLFQDNNTSEMVLTAMGRAINKAVMLAEILKRRIEGLHQNISLSSSYVKDVWEPLEEGLVTLEMVRHVSMISITLSTKELDVSSCGYQPPTLRYQPPTFIRQVQPLAESNQEEGGYRGAGRTYVRGRSFERRNMCPSNGYHNCLDENWNPGRGKYHGRDRGYDAGGRGYNKGYSQADNRGYNNSFSQNDRRGQNNYYPPAVKSHPQADMRGYNKGYSQADNRGYNNAYSQGDRPGQNNYYPPAVARRYNGGNSQANVRGHIQPQADARGYGRPRRVLHQYNNGYPQGSYDNSAGDQNSSFQRRGRGAFGGRGRGRFG